MASRYWMISNRKPTGTGSKRKLGKDDEGIKRFYSCPLSTDGKAIRQLDAWTEHSASEFRNKLIDATSAFPPLSEERQEDQRHLTLYVHGYNNTWDGAATRYKGIVDSLYVDQPGRFGLGECLFFTWPSDGSVAAYLPDRRDANSTADDFSDLLAQLYDWMLSKQGVTGKNACRAKTSIIAHSMGAYVVQEAMYDVWNRKNRPLLVSLINQLLMVSADVDNDIFASGESVGKGSGEGIANLAYRITALYTGLDSVLGTSAGLKHFGKRRLGRSGLDRTQPLPDNVWDVDMTQLFEAGHDYGSHHSAAFESPAVLSLMREILRGVDRRILVRNRTAPATEGMAVTPVTTENVAPFRHPKCGRRVGVGRPAGYAFARHTTGRPRGL